MRVLIAYDGTAGADDAVGDLARAGLPARGEARVLTISDALLPKLVPAPVARGTDDDRAAQRVAWVLENVRAVNERGVAQVARRLPGWVVHGFSRSGSAASTLLLHADAWNADLVVVGSRGRARVARMLLGSVARKVVADAHCSVRVARTSARAYGAPVRILVGHDGRDGGRDALRAAAARAWPNGSAIVVVAVHAPAAVTMFANEVPWEVPWPVPVEPSDRGTLRSIVESDAAACRRDDLPVTAEIRMGDPVATLLREARSGTVDAIFVGATGTNRLERFLIGSVAAAVSDRARCSVEVVRRGRAAGSGA